jgi:hypothetical protein
MAVPINVQNAINDGYEFKFGDYISRGFQIVQKNLGQFIVGALVIFVVLIGTSMVSGAIGAGLAILGGVAGIVINQVISQAAQAAVSGSLLAGLYNAAHKTDNGKVVEFGDFFAGFNKWVPLFTTAIMVSLVVLASMIPGIYLMYQGGLDFSLLTTPGGIATMEDIDFGNIALGVAVAAIPAIYLSVSYVYAPLLTWFYGVSGWEALETSRQLVSKNFFPVLGFMLVMGVIAGLGIILFCVGLLFTFPAYTSAIYASFEDIVGLNRAEGRNSDEVIDHFAPQM